MAKPIGEALEEFRGVLKERVIKNSAVRAVNRALVTTRAQASRRVREQLKLKAADAKAAFTIKQATPSAPVEQITGDFIIKGRPVPLVQYGAKTRTIRTNSGPRIGVSVNVKGERKVVRGAFLATMRTGYVGIFIRGRKGSTYESTGPRRPIRQLFSTSVVDLFGKGPFLDEMVAFAKRTSRENFLRELAYQVERQKGS